MALTEQSPLEAALSRIVGAPASQAGTDEFQLAPRSSLISYAPDAFTPAEQTVDLGAANRPKTTPVAVQRSAPSQLDQPGVRQPFNETERNAWATQAIQPMGTATPQQPAAAPLWKGYNEFFAGNPEALKWGHYQTTELPGSPMDRFFGADKNPWRFMQEFNQYKATLPKEYQTLIGAGINPEMVRSGAVHSVLMDGKVTPIPGAIR